MRNLTKGGKVPDDQDVCCLLVLCFWFNRTKVALVLRQVTQITILADGMSFPYESEHSFKAKEVKFTLNY